MNNARSGIIALPEEQLRPLVQSYAAAAAQSARRAVLFTAVLAAAILLASWVAEIDPKLFFAKIGNFTSYFDRIAKLDSGERVWTDPVEWFWGLKKWGRLLFETILISYMGTLAGAFAHGSISGYFIVLDSLRRADQCGILDHRITRGLQDLLTLLQQSFHPFADNIPRFDFKLVHDRLQTFQVLFGHGEMLLKGSLQVFRGSCLCHLRQCFDELLFRRI